MNKTTYYINGNAVRELDEAAPVRRPQKSTRELEEIRRKKNRRTSARRNQERALSMNRAFVAFLTACVAASALVSVSLIQIRSNVTQQMKEVAALESRINDMKADNDARYYICRFKCNQGCSYQQTWYEICFTGSDSLLLN